MKRISVFLIAAAYAAISAQNAGLSEKDIPKKVIATRNAKAKVLKHKDTVWSKNEAGEFVAERKIGGNAAEETPPDQTITARFKEDGTWIQTETLSSPYNDKVKGRMIPGNVQKACKKLGEPMMMGPVTVTEGPKGSTYKLSCAGGDTVTFDKKAKVLKKE
ncbi:MAG: hypothetical protein ACOY5B_05955 [Spirochaetota bacterium]